MNRIPVFIIIAACILTRLPQLLNPAIALDGDECVSALMVKHIIAGTEFPLYFYGQNYGFTLIESLFCIPLSLIAGVTTFSIKASILILWTIGVVYFFKTLKSINISSKYIPLLLTLLLATTPAWAVWAMKARGGYTTAFTFTSIVLYLLLNKQTQKLTISWIAAGLLSGVIYEAQPGWFIILAPIVAYLLFASSSIKNLLAYLVPATTTAVLFFWYKQSLIQLAPQITKDINSIVQHIDRIPQFLYTHIGGKYYLSELYPPNLFMVLAAYFFIAIIIILVVFAAYSVVQRKHGLYIASVLSIILLIASTTISQYLAPRHLLPLSGAILISVQLLLNYINPRKSIFVVINTALVICAIATMSFWNFESGRISRTALNEIVHSLKKKNIHHAFVTYAVLDYQLMFYSDEDIIARSKWAPGRYPKYFEMVDAAFSTEANTAVVGHNWEYDGMTLDITQQTNEYFIAVHPDKKEVLRVFYGIN